MSYANTHCPCGGRKAPDTMLCQACEEVLRTTQEHAAMNNGNLPIRVRRSAAIRVLSYSRKRRSMATH